MFSGLPEEDGERSPDGDPHEDEDGHRVPDLGGGGRFGRLLLPLSAKSFFFKIYHLKWVCRGLLWSSILSPSLVYYYLIKSTKLVAFLRPRKSREANEIRMHFEVGGISCCISQIALAPLGLYGVVYRRRHAQLGATLTKGARLQTTCY